MTQIDSDIRARIIKAAEEMFEASGRERMPTVSDVRRAAKVDMNTASDVMRDWKRALTAQTAPIAVAVPESVSKAFSAALGEAWQQAQQFASESLKAAQQGWESERKELDEMRVELATAYEQQAVELAAVIDATAIAEQQAAADAADAERRSAADAADAAQKVALIDADLKAVRDDLLKSNSRADQAQTKAQEVEHRVTDLHAELERTRKQVDEHKASVSEAAKSREAVAKELEKARAELSKITSKLELSESRNESDKSAHDEQYQRFNSELAKSNDERDAARKEAAMARELAAELKGELKAVEKQTAALVARIPQATNAKK